MIEQVVKRDGRKEPFVADKIIKAINKCLSSTNRTISNSNIQDIITTISNLNQKTISVEKIQDIIVKKLSLINEAIANKYQQYRIERSKIRDLNINGEYYNTVLELTEGIPNEVSKENGNKDATQFNVMRDLIAGETCKKLYKENIMSPYINDLHSKGILHVHDTDYRLMKGVSNCELIHLEDVLQRGTVLNGKRINKPHSLRTATTITTQVMLGVSSLTYGGMSITLTHLAPFVRISKNYYETYLSSFPYISKVDKERMVDEMLKKEISDSIQTLLYQLNSMTSSNGQSPFCTIFCYIHENEEYVEETCLLIEELLKQRIKGMEGPTGQNINPAFPKIIYVLDEDNITENTKYFWLTKLAAECTCKRMVPDYISAKIMKKYKEGNVFPSMGCRSFLHPWKNEKGEYQFYGRLNIGVISINLPYLALASKDYEDFLHSLDEMIDTVSSEQYKVYQTISNTSTDVAPLLWNYGVLARAPRGSKIGDVIKKEYCSASIGYMGIAECVYHFGKEYPTEEGQQMGLDIIKHMYDRANYNKKKYKLALSLYGTPAENTTTKFAKALKVFPEEKHVNDRTYITNSYHIPVTYPIDGYRKIEFEAPFQEYSSGGCISYIECSDVRKNPEAILNILKCIYDNMMYCEINTTSCDVCYTCGYEGEIHMDSEGKLSCPNCGETNPHQLYAIRRLCGYIGVLTNGISKGRIGDINDRVKHF